MNDDKIKQLHPFLFRFTGLYNERKDGDDDNQGGTQQGGGDNSNDDLGEGD